jgi:hypothetical protein
MPDLVSDGNARRGGNASHVSRCPGGPGSVCSPVPLPAFLVPRSPRLIRPPLPLSSSFLKGTVKTEAEVARDVRAGRGKAGILLVVVGGKLGGRRDMASWPMRRRQAGRGGVGRVRPPDSPRRDQCGNRWRRAVGCRDIALISGNVQRFWDDAWRRAGGCSLQPLQNSTRCQSRPLQMK